MLEIHENPDHSAYSAQLAKINKDNTIVVESFENGEVTGYGIYSCDTNKVIIHDFSYTDNLYLLDGIIRTMLFKANMQGIDLAEFDIIDNDKLKLLDLLKYNKKIDSINYFFSNCKKCKELK